MLNKSTFFLAVLFVTNCLTIASSETLGFKECNFRAYGNLTLIGGLQNRVPATSKFRCILGCASNASCQGFTYDGGVCLQADRSNATSLDFAADPGNIRIRRNVLLQNLNYDPVSLLTEYNVTLVNKLSFGDLLYLKAVLLKQDNVTIEQDNVTIEIYDKPDKVNITYQMNVTCNDTSCGKRYLTINSKRNGKWIAVPYKQDISYTLEVNKVFEVHVLITANGTSTFFNGVFLYTNKSVFSAVTANFVYIRGNIKLLEFSL